MVAEGGKHPRSLRFTRLNESAIKSAIIKANEWMIYNDFEANCSSHLKACLEAGTSGAAMAAD